MLGSAVLVVDAVLLLHTVKDLALLLLSLRLVMLQLQVVNLLPSVLPLWTKHVMPA
jgi:hypothetical protein